MPLPPVVTSGGQTTGPLILRMPSFRLSLRTAVIVPFIAVFVLAVGLLSFWQQRQVDKLIDQESMRLLDAITIASRQQLI